jgi:hypothetical protein
LAVRELRSAYSDWKSVGSRMLVCGVAGDHALSKMRGRRTILPLHSLNPESEQDCRLSNVGH